MNTTTGSDETAYYERCDVLLDKYGIDKSIRSLIGWRRACLNDKLDLYTPNPLSNETKQQICACLTDKRNFKEEDELRGKQR